MVDQIESDSLKKEKLLYQGKAKDIYQTNDKDYVIMHYRDDATAFNGVKKASLSDKGRVNNRFNAFVMDLLEKEGIKTHFVDVLSDNESIVKSLEMLKVECVIRNYAAGSICKRLGLKKGYEFKTPLFEFFYKSDELDDPMIAESHILALEMATNTEIDQMKEITFKVNEILRKLFDKANLDLVDFKIEFGRYNGKLILGDEFTPDGCRLWDKTTKKVMDKDRFRQDLGDVIETYKEVLERLGIDI